jgi:hypothetical protein
MESRLCQILSEVLLRMPTNLGDALGWFGAQGRVVRELKEQGATKLDPTLMAQVVELLDAKAAKVRLDERSIAVAAVVAAAAAAAAEDERNRLEGPVWMLRPQLVHFVCTDGRVQAQELCAALAAEFCVQPTKKAAKANHARG